jgi:hypothetical protein
MTATEMIKQYSFIAEGYGLEVISIGRAKQIMEEFAQWKEITDTVDKLFKLFDENILIRNTDNDYDFARFTEEGLRITDVLQKLEHLKQR